MLSSILSKSRFQVHYKFKKEGGHNVKYGFQGQSTRSRHWATTGPGNGFVAKGRGCSHPSPDPLLTLWPLRKGEIIDVSGLRGGFCKATQNTLDRTWHTRLKNKHPTMLAPFPTYKKRRLNSPEVQLSFPDLKRSDFYYTPFHTTKRL